MSQCPVCQNHLGPGLRSWHSVCSACGYEAASFAPEINSASQHELVNEQVREAGLKQLRVDNFKTLVSQLTALRPYGGHLLDVGCAHGWFIEQAQQHFTVLGIEPDAYVANQTRIRGLVLRNGYFPDVLTPTEKFDVIVFNDVFEHIPDVTATLAHCRTHLTTEGILLLNLPSSRGAFFKASKLLAQTGWSQPFERMWQKALPSPHLHYFDSANLGQLLTTQGFDIITTGNLPTVRLKGLYERIVCADGFGKLGDCVVYLIALAALPFVRLFPSDIIYVIARKNSGM